MARNRQRPRHQSEKLERRLQKGSARIGERQTSLESSPAAIIRRASVDPRSLTPQSVLQLQRTLGNQTVSRLVETIQRFPVEEEDRGGAHNIRGGTSMTAKVGAESEWVYGSKPPGGVPNLLTKVGSFIQGKQRYIAGHLLNDNMGGQGVNNNLTVLSSNGNKRHRGVEGKVKELAQKADLINGGNHYLGNPAYDHGARYTVEVLDPQPAAKTRYSQQEKYIGAGLLIDIDPIRIHKQTGVESAWPEEAGGPNDLTNHVVNNVPPYPLVPKKQKLTPRQRQIVLAILALKQKSGSTHKDIWKFIQANYDPAATKVGVSIALRRGVTTKFFLKRAGRFKVIAKNIV